MTEHNTRMTDDDISDALRMLPQWARTGDSLTRAVTAPTFLDAIDLVTRVAHAAEEVDHHPDIDIRWRTVTFTVSTHSAGGITALDVALASTIDRLAAP